MQMATLLHRHRAVGLVFRLGGGNAALLLVEPVRLAGRELAGGDAGIDARLLVRFALVDARRLGLREGAHRSDGDGDAGGECRELVHGGVLRVVVESNGGLRVPPEYNGSVHAAPTPAP